jgi:hypothetical protein
MKHAGPAALDTLEPLLARIRAQSARGGGVLREKSRGIFYLKSRAFLHFHEDPAGTFVDIRALDGKDFDRLKLDAAAEAEVLARIAALKAGN